MDLKLLSDDGVVLRLEMTSGIVEADFTPALTPLEDFLGPGCYARNILLSLAQITLVDSGCFAWLLMIHKRLSETGGRLVLHSIPPRTMEILHILHFDAILHIAENEAAAMEMLRDEP